MEKLIENLTSMIQSHRQENGASGCTREADEKLAWDVYCEIADYQSEPDAYCQDDKDSEDLFADEPAVEIRGPYTEEELERVMYTLNLVSNLNFKVS
tara:strand:+ start:134 stop:424 length:291 start_codon:yes stop_codon:yes gene_type:complete